jgi:beta-glucosidase-like glycosyl hydrolase
VRAVAAEARHVGINMPLLPVLDVNRNPDNPIICTRAFSDQPGEVAWFGETFVRVLEGEGMVSCGKHFPGHGDTSVDSHLSLPVIAKPLETLMREDLVPFQAAVRAGASSLMIGHLSVPCLDDRPASLSKDVIGGLLRRDLGFTGLVVTDALNMGGIAGISDVAAASVEAGADLLLHPSDPHAAVGELLAAVDSGRIAEEKIDRSVERILKKKRELTRETRGPGIDIERHRLLASAITERSVTLVKALPGLLPLHNTGSTAVLCAGDADLYRSSLVEKTFHPPLSLNGAAESLANPPGRVVVVAIFTSVTAWKGSSGIGEDDRRAILRLIASPARTIVVSFGSPYVLRHFPEAQALVAAYEPTEAAQTAVLRALQGEAPFRGRLPVTLP